MNETNTRVHNSGRAVLLTCLCFSTGVFAGEETANEPPPFTEPTSDSYLETSSIGRSENVESKLSAEFSEFLGSGERAADVVEGLRTGDEFTLAAAVSPDGTTTTMSTPGNGLPSATSEAAGTTVINPPTGTMGYGNVRITLRLAEAQLAKMGINQPTNEELSAMLVGGEIDGVQVKGILNERAAGAGWGEIAKNYDFKVGQLMGKAPATEATSQPIDETGNQVTSETATPSNGYIPSGKTNFTYASKPADKQHAMRSVGKNSNGYIASGSPSQMTSANQGAHGVGRQNHNGAKKNGYIPSGKTVGSGAGIVTAQGVSTASRVEVGHGQSKGRMNGYVPSGGNGHGSGIVSATNTSTSAAVSSAGGRGHAKGSVKVHGKSR